MEDGGIIALFFERSEQAIGELDRKYGPAAKRLAMNILADGRDAEECVNDACLAVWSTIPPQLPSSLGGYFCRIVRNIAAKRYRANVAQKRNSHYDAALDELSECLAAPGGPESALDAARPAPVIGYEPDEELLARIVQPNHTYQFYYSTLEDIEQLREFIQTNAADPTELDAQIAQLDAQEALTASGDPDDLDHCLETGYISQEEYDGDMSARTERGKAAGLHYESAIWLDAFLERELTGEEYEDLWAVLERDGAACVVLQDVHIGDHMLVEGVDIAAASTDVEAGTFIEAQTPAENGGDTFRRPAGAAARPGRAACPAQGQGRRDLLLHDPGRPGLRPV